MFPQPSIKIIIREKRGNALGEVPICLQYIQNRKLNRISLKKRVKPETWAYGKEGKYVFEKGKHTHPLAKEMNFFLRKELLRAEKIILDFQNKDQVINFTAFKEHFLGGHSQDFLSYADQYIRKKNQQGMISSGTVQGLHSRLKKLKGFRSKLSFSDIDKTFLEDYTSYLSKELGNSPNTAATALKFIRQVLRRARMDQLLSHYPFAEFKMPSEKVQHVFLSYEEVAKLHRLWHSQVLKSSLQNVLQYFLFSCYTGLDYGDASSLEYTSIEIHDSFPILQKKRLKTNNVYVIPLSKKALELIDQSKIGSSELAFRSVSNQKTNSYLKEITAMVSIRKSVSFHTARHTFGTLSLNLGIPQEVVQKMMGHATLRMTSHYARVQHDYLITEMQKWDLRG